VLAGEGTGNLDRETSDGAIGLMLAPCRESGMALVVVTHDPALPARCARDAVGGGGRVAADA
jgi:predicted ABC-type transport system involved in lysophospholipase L1 biosynthesis ATPase subunit